MHDSARFLGFFRVVTVARMVTAQGNMADPTKQYDISPEQLKLLQARNARRNVLRQEYLKQAGDPYRAGSGEGGFPFDAGLQRFIAARVKTYDYFRPTLKGFTMYYCSVFLPIGLFAWLLKSTKDKEEHRYRTGQVSYAERRFKFI